MPKYLGSSAVLWLQYGYVVWQFVRVAKYCRIPYAVVVHTFMWLTGRWSRPFSVRTFLVLGTGREKFYLDRGGAESVLKDCLDRTDCFKVENIDHSSSGSGDRAMISIPAVNYKLCIGESTINQSFVWNYLRDKPDCFARTAEVLVPGLVILDRLSDLEGLEMTCQGGFIPEKRRDRVLAVPDSQRDFDQNFMRLLSTVPVMVQALGCSDASVWISVAILVVDLVLSRVCNSAWEFVTCWFFHLLSMCLDSTATYFGRETVSSFCAIVSQRMKHSDQVRRSLIRVKGGDVVYTMSPFNLADFEKIVDRPFERKRKTPEAYSEEKFGKFTFCGEEMEFKEGSPVLTHYVDGARIDSIFKDDGSFFNFRNNEHLHFGIWKTGKDKPKDSIATKDPEDSEGTKDLKEAADTDDNFNNFQDLLQIMEEIQMLPFIQLGKDRFRSMDFNMFLSPGRSLKDFTFVVAKQTFIIGG